MSAPPIKNFGKLNLISPVHRFRTRLQFSSKDYALLLLGDVYQTILELLQTAYTVRSYQAPPCTCGPPFLPHCRSFRARTHRQSNSREAPDRAAP